MSDLPRLELTGDPNKKNDYIIFRYSTNSKKIKHNKPVNTKTITKKRRTHAMPKRKGRKTRKGFLNIF